MASKANAPGREDRGARVEKKSGGKKMTLIIASAVLLLGAGGGGAAWYMSRTQDGAPFQTRHEPPVFVNLETFTVNLQSEHGDQHLQTNLTLKMEDSSAADLIKLHMPEVRNRVLLLLSSKAASQINGVEGKKKLASELLEEIKQPSSERSPGHAVQSVLFTSFVIQ
ncbi:flagellar FliL protein [Nitrosospira sp. Nsp5]|uniref:Flagellar protein FliL n=1 Tax=Nitrosospira multiformis TaxID=1231 RepID=A0ABY0TE79_9PROT|nr:MULTISPECIES: flagellar basal body-associated protein FliL [Nitrosospira]PTR09044.1 flagellar FliL protein [Nitrosospira sp. Nsp5]SDQ69674.1 flagellar FliL protein [Nitrosospira multiformis]